MQLASRQHRLQHVAGIQCTVCFARTDDGMQLINKQNDLPFALLHILQHCLQTLFKFAPILGTCYQCTHIQCEDLFILQPLGYVAPHDSLCQSFDNGGLTDAGFTDQNRVVLRFSGKNPNHVTNFIIPADDRIELLGSRLFYQILSVLLQCIISSLRIVRNDSLIAAHRGQCL